MYRASYAQKTPKGVNVVLNLSKGLKSGLVWAPLGQSA